MVYQVDDVRVQGGPLPLRFQRTYNSLSLVSGPFGYGWTHPYNVWLSLEPPAEPGVYQNVYLYAHDGAVFHFERQPDGTYSEPAGVHRTLTQSGGLWSLRYRNGIVQYFENATSPYLGGLVGRLTAVEDPNGNQTILEYDFHDRLRKITDPAGRALDLSYVGSSLLIRQITDPAGHVTEYQYTAQGDLSRVTYPDGTQGLYYYAGHQMVFHDDPWAPPGQKAASYSYDTPGHGKVVGIGFPVGSQSIDYGTGTTSVTDAHGRVTTIEYNDQKQVTAVVDAAGGLTSYTFDAEHNVTSRTDPNGRLTTFGYDGQGNIVSVTDPLGHTTSYAFDPNFNRLLQVVDALARTTVYDYDAEGDLLSVTDPLGGVTSYDYAGCCLLTAITDANGHTTQMDYDGYGNLAVITNTLGYATTFTNDILGNRLSKTDARGFTTAYAYDAAGRLVQETNAVGDTASYSYDARGNLASQTDERGFTLTYDYDDMDHLIQVGDALGFLTTYDYDEVGHLVGETDANGNTTTYGYDALDHNVVITDALGYVKAYGYDAVGNLASSTDANGHTTSYGYDGLDHTVAVTDALGYVTSFQYDAVGNIIGQTDTGGRHTSFGFDALDRQLVMTDALGYLTTYLYDPVGNLISETNANGYTTAYGYDAQDQLTVITDALGFLTTYDYDEVGNLVRETDAGGSATAYGYDALNRVVSVTDALGYVMAYTYSAVGYPETVTDASGNVTHYGYDPLNRMVAITDALGFTLAYGYDPVDNLVARTNQEGNTVTYGYDALNRMTTITDPLGHTTIYGYDAVGNLVSESDAEGNVTTTTYDPLNRLAGLTNALGHTSGYAYDPLSNMRTVTDARGNATVYEYDDLHRLIRETYADGGTVSYGYDAVGNLETIQDQNGSLSTYTYDQGNRLADVDIQRGSGVGGTTFKHYERDAVGRLTLAQDDDSLVVWTYDAVGQVITTTQDGVDIAYAYDGTGFRTHLAYPDGRTLTYLPDTRNRIDQILNQDLSLIADYDYLGSGRVDRRTYGNGVALSVDYDANGRITSYDHSLPSPIGLEYGYDGVGNRLFESRDHEGGAGDAYAYDPVYQLVNVQYGLDDPGSGGGDPVSETSYSLDAVGNRVSMVSDGQTVSYTSNQVNEYELAGDVELLHDANGNLIRSYHVVTGTVVGGKIYLPAIFRNSGDGTLSAQVPAPLGPTAFLSPGAVLTETATYYEYDYENRLLSVSEVITVTANGGSNAVAEVLAVFQYDAVGRRTTKATASGTTHYYYDGAQVLEERQEGTTTAQYVYGLDVDDVLQVVHGGQIYYYHQDGLGSITTMSDSAGQIVEQYSYDVYGQPAVVSAEGKRLGSSAIGNPYLFTARRWDEELGLYFYRTRTYCPRLGRFLQRDPIGYVDGLNLYTYVQNNPVNAVDPFGLEHRKVTIPSDPLSKDSASWEPIRCPSSCTQDIEACWFKITVEYDWVDIDMSGSKTYKGPANFTISFETAETNVEKGPLCCESKVTVIWTAINVHRIDDAGGSGPVPKEEEKFPLPGQPPVTYKGKLSCIEIAGELELTCQCKTNSSKATKRLAFRFWY